MQLTVFIASELVQALRSLALQDCRSLHQEAKSLLTQAIKQVVREREGSQAEEETEVCYASHHGSVKTMTQGAKASTH